MTYLCMVSPIPFLLWALVQGMLEIGVTDCSHSQHRRGCVIDEDYKVEVAWDNLDGG